MNFRRARCALPDRKKERKREREREREDEENISAYLLVLEFSSHFQNSVVNGDSALSFPTFETNSVPAPLFQPFIRLHDEKFVVICSKSTKESMTYRLGKR